MYSTHYLFSFGGTLGGGEIWNCGIRCRPAGRVPVVPDPRSDANMAAIAAQLKTWWQDPVNLFPNTARLTWYKLNAIDTDGKYLNRNHTNVWDIVNAPGSTQPHLPAFLSVAVTWRTERTRPPGSAGRIYLPNYGVSPASLDPCIITDNVQDAVAGTAKRLLDIVTQTQTQAGANVAEFVPVIASKVDGSLNDITGIDVGERADVQRRRESAIPENYRNIAYDFRAAG